MKGNSKIIPVKNEIKFTMIGLLFFKNLFERKVKSAKKNDDSSPVIDGT